MVFSKKSALSLVVRPPVSISPASVKSPVVAVMLKMREFCKLASIVTLLASAVASICERVADQ